MTAAPIRGNAPAGRTRRLALDQRDWVLSLLLFAAVVVYLASLPRTLGIADESYFLYEARRIREGQVMYRDFFQFVTPGAWYLMAALYGLFGTNIVTARISMAVLHGLTAVLFYSSGRLVGVRRSLSLLPPLAYVALCQPAWPYASPHWFSTFMTALLLLATLRLPWPERPRSCAALGMICGLFLFVQQQKGVALTAGIVCLLAADVLLSRRCATSPASRLAAKLAWFSGGFLIVVVPLTVALSAAAGWRPVFDDLVLFPLYEYRGAVRVAWGGIGILSRGFAEYTWPTVLRFIPVAMVVPLSRVLLHLVRRTDRERVHLLTILIAFCGFSCLSTLYNRDFIHLAFVAPVCFVTFVETVEWALTQTLPAGFSYAAGWLLTASLGTAFGYQLRDNAVRAWSGHPIRHETAFGRIDFREEWEPILIDKVRELLGESPSKDIFCYPSASSPYLTTGGKNPTPYQYLDATASPPQYLSETVSLLRAKDVPYVITAPALGLSGKDPIARFIHEHYEYVDIGVLPKLWLFRRKDLDEQRGDEQPVESD